MNSWESKTTIIIPTYNERDTIKKLISEIFLLHPKISILVVDDNSPDGTANVVTTLKKQYPAIELLRRSQKNGLGTAYKDAYSLLLQRPHVHKIITMDADGSHNPLHLQHMLTMADTHDLVIGSRYVHQGGVSNWSRWRRMLSKWGNIYSQILCLVRIKDLTAGFICVSKDFAKKLDIPSISSAGYSYQIEFKYRCVRSNAHYVEIPIIFMERHAGESKMSKKIIKEGLITPFRIFIATIRRKISYR